MPFVGKKRFLSRANTPTSREYRTNAALAWLRRSVEATGGCGSAHSWSPFFGWSKAYPETTGYLIETLYDYALIQGDTSLNELAEQCADWLVSIQLPGGAFPALLAGSTRPSVFNSAMILFGLARAERTATLAATAGWLLAQLDTDGAWRRYAYVDGFTPAYYTRAVWALLAANRIWQQDTTGERMREALDFYAARILPNGAVRDWGFLPGKPAYTHTIGYTLEGFLESAVLLNDVRIIEKIILAGEKFIQTRKQAGRTAGCYDERWRGNYSFLCITGNCQLSIFFRRLGAVTGEPRYGETARELLFEVIDYQALGKNINIFGALPGSAPCWGPYMRFRYPNWGVKFFLDALKWEI
jgi:hypothetical protein